MSNKVAGFQVIEGFQVNLIDPQIIDVTDS